MSFINKISDNDLLELINLYAKVIDINKERFYQLAKKAEKYYKNPKDIRNEIRFLQDLEKRWYKSLEKGDPDYSVYDEKYYVADLWACWKIYSRQYLKVCAKQDSNIGKSVIDTIGTINTVVDLGCGLSYSTAALKELFPNSSVFGTNLQTSPQFIFNKLLANKYNYAIIENVDEINIDIDLIFASEYFEHFEYPIDHLETILNKNPKHLIIANAFGSISIGHFNFYYHKNKRIENKKMGRYFNNYLRSRGFEQQETKFWNNRPTYWVYKNRKSLL